MVESSLQILQRSGNQLVESTSFPLCRSSNTSLVLPAGIVTDSGALIPRCRSWPVRRTTFGNEAAAAALLMVTEIVFGKILRHTNYNPKGWEESSRRSQTTGTL